MGARSLIEIVKKYYLRIIVIAHHSYWSVALVCIRKHLPLLPNLPTPPRFPVISSSPTNRANFRNLAEGLHKGN